MYLLKLAYSLGSTQARQNLGLPINSVDAFTQAVDQQDRDGDPNDTLEFGVPDKPTHWSGGASIESGDAGTRNYQMGLPGSHGAV